MQVPGSAILVPRICNISHFASRGCLLVRKSFFNKNLSNFVDLGGGILGCTLFHPSFRAATALSLNIGPFLSSISPVPDIVVVSTTMIMKPGPDIDFLLANQKFSVPSMIDWVVVVCVVIPIN